MKEMLKIYTEFCFSPNFHMLNVSKNIYDPKKQFSLEEYHKTELLSLNNKF